MERRILTTHRAGEAWKDFTEEPKYAKTRWRAFQRTGFLLTVDGSDDPLVTPEGLPDYQMPPISLLNPPNQRINFVPKSFCFHEIKESTLLQPKVFKETLVVEIKETISSFLERTNFHKKSY